MTPEWEALILHALKERLSQRGVHPRIEADLLERFRLLVNEHYRQSARQWQRRQDEAAAATQSNP